MNIAQEMHAENINWNIFEKYIPIESSKNKINNVQRLCIELTDLNKPLSDRKTFQHITYSDIDSLEINNVLFAAMKLHMPDHPLVFKYEESLGHQPVEIYYRDLNENLSHNLHLALRTSDDSCQNIIQWNAIHHLHPDDWLNILELIRNNINNEVEKTQENDQQLTRYKVGMTIRNTLFNQFYDIVKQPVERTDLQKISLQSFEMACRLTKNQDYVWNWTSYICSDIIDEESYESSKYELIREC